MNDSRLIRRFAGRPGRNRSAGPGRNSVETLSGINPRRGEHTCGNPLKVVSRNSRIRYANQQREEREGRLLDRDGRLRPPSMTIPADRELAEPNRRPIHPARRGMKLMETKSRCRLRRSRSRFGGSRRRVITSRAGVDFAPATSLPPPSLPRPVICVLCMRSDKCDIRLYGRRPQNSPRV